VIVDCSFAMSVWFFRDNVCCGCSMIQFMGGVCSGR